MRRTLLLLLAAMLALPACTQETQAPSQTRQQASEPAPAQEFDPEQERAIKKQWQERLSPQAIRSRQAISKRVSEIDWSQAKTFEQVDLAQIAENKLAENKLAENKLDANQLTDDQLARLLDAPVPALVPVRPELFSTPTVTSGEHWYAVSLDGDAHSVYVSGTRLVTVVEGLELVDEQPNLKKDFRITRTDGIVSLSVNAFGAAYTIEVECARPGSDARCLEDDYVVSLANALAVPSGQVPTKGGLR